MPDRKHPPKRSANSAINIIKANEIALPNGIRLLVINAGTQEVSRLELNFHAGSRYQVKPLVARSAFSMLTEGTANFSSQQIAETFDFYGSFVEQSSDRDFGKITLFSLNKYLDKSLNLLEELIKFPSFPDKELDTFRKKGKQSLIVELEKVSTLARIDLYKGIYGIDHPYGISAEPDDFDLLSRSDLAGFHEDYLNASNCIIVLSGKVGEIEINRVINHFGQTKWGNVLKPLPELPGITDPGIRKYFSPKEDAVQSAIRIGKRLMNRKHPDYPGVMVLNTILGGYFGSRLMKNIREEKGYTYGISSSILHFKEECMLAIGTEVGKEFTIPTLNEIYSEIDRLLIEPVGHDELELVRNYLLGEVLRNFDGAFAIADSISGLLEYNDLDYSFFDRTINVIKTISPDQLLNLANVYLRRQDMIECVAGSVSNI